MKRIGVYPGSFDPFTAGHMDMLHHASGLFDIVYVGVLNNSAKSAMFTPVERVEMIRKAVGEEGFTNVRVESFNGLLVDFAKEVGARYIIRGLRAITDFEYEFQIDAINHHMEPEIQTVYFMARPALSFLSSSSVKEIGSYGGSISGLVPDCNLNFITERLRKQ